MAIITISRGSFSGGLRVAESVADKLGYRCLSREELVKAAATRYGVKEEKLSEAINEVPGIWVRWSMERLRYITCLRAALVREVSLNNVVYHGHGGHLLLWDVPTMLRVRIIANMELRIKFAMERNGLTREKAIDYIRSEDEKRSKWTRFLYQQDWSDPSSYDLVVNIETLDFDDICEILAVTAKLDRFKANPDTQKVVNDLMLTTEVEAILAMQHNLDDSGVKVKADNGIITLSGMMDWEDKADKIKKIVMGVPGVSGVNSKIRIRQVF